MKNIENEVIDNYTRNLTFLETRFPNIYKKVSDLSLKFELGVEKEQFSLEYKDNKYFDIVLLNNNTNLYGKNSNSVTNEITATLDLSNSSSSFNMLFNNFKSLGNIYNYSNDLFSYMEENRQENEYSFIPKFIFIRTLLGLHIPKVIDKLGVRDCLIYEPNIEIFRLSLFTTRYYEIAKNTNIVFSIDEPLDQFKDSFFSFYSNNFNNNYIIKYYSFDEEKLEYIQKMILNLQATMMDYTRKLNLNDQTVNNLTSEYKILNINNLKDKFKDKKILLLGSGPSLDDSIEYLKKNQKEFFILSVGANILTLKEHNIKPDIICEIHPEDNILDNYKGIDKEFLSDTLLLGASSLPKGVFEFFSKENIFIYLTVSSIKTELGAIFASSVGNHMISLALTFGFGEIYLLGLDFAFLEDGRTHTSLHAHISNMYELGSNEDIKSELFLIPGNFKESIQTNSLFFKFLEEANFLISKYKNKKIYNLSDGALVNGTIPLKQDKLNSFNINNKIELLNEVKEILDKNSITILSKDELSFLTSYIPKLEKIINYTCKKNEVRAYINSLIVDESLDEEYRAIIVNYLQNIIPYIDGFLNNKSFNYKKQNKHLSNLTLLMYNDFIKITKEYKNILNKLNT